MRPHNIMLGFPNRIDQCSITGGSWVATLPLANLKNRLFSRVARSTGLALSQTTFTLDMGQPQPIRLFALVAHNLSVTARVRLEAADAPDFATTVFDQTFDAWGSAANAAWSIAQLEWESDNYWLGTYTSEQIEGFTAVSQHVLPGEEVARYWRVTIKDPDNTDGYVEAGRVFIGSAAQATINYAWGASLGYEFGTVVETSLSGAEFFDVREGVRVFRCVLQHMADDEAYGTFLEIVRRGGVHSEIMVIPDPTDMTNGIRRNFMGRLRQPSPLEQMTWMNGGSANSMAFELKELR